LHEAQKMNSLVMILFYSLTNNNDALNYLYNRSVFML
jgi:hypothetical protein